MAEYIVNGGQDILAFNAIGGGYLRPNPNYGVVQPSITPLAVAVGYGGAIVSPPFFQSPLPGPGGSFFAQGLGASSAYAIPTPLVGPFPIQPRTEDGEITFTGFTFPGAGAAAPTTTATTIKPAQTLVGGSPSKPFPWLWVAVGVLAVMLLTDRKDRR